MDELEEAIKKTLIEFAENHPAVTRKEWTDGIIDVLSTLGDDSYDCEILGGDYESGWLFDLVWCKYDNERKLVHVELVVECEWNQGRNHIQTDFEKLVVARAQHRLMIFEATSDSRISEHINFLNSIVDGFPSALPGDRYLYAALNSKSEEFLFSVKQKQ